MEFIIAAVALLAGLAWLTSWFFRTDWAGRSRFRHMEIQARNQRIATRQVQVDSERRINDLTRITFELMLEQAVNRRMNGRRQ